MTSQTDFLNGEFLEGSLLYSVKQFPVVGNTIDSFIGLFTYFISFFSFLSFLIELQE